jgi:hypothetical protein
MRLVFDEMNGDVQVSFVARGKELVSVGLRGTRYQSPDCAKQKGYRPADKLDGL